MAYTNFYLIVLFLLSCFSSINLALTFSLLVASYKYDNQYLWLFSTYITSCLSVGITKSFAIILFGLAYYGFYNNIINKGVINDYSRMLLSILMRYKFFVNLRTKLENINLPEQLVVANEKLNNLVAHTEKLIMALIFRKPIILDDKPKYIVVKEEQEQEPEVVTTIVPSQKKEEVVVEDKTKQFLATMLNVDIKTLDDLYKMDSSIGLNSEELKALELILNSTS